MSKINGKSIKSIVSEEAKRSAKNGRGIKVVLARPLKKVKIINLKVKSSVMVAFLCRSDEV